ncbi:MAG: type II toxin-antitoxin system VapC family toxin [Verrucomicrobiota bacterium]
MTVLLDSSGWVELLGGTKRADFFEPALKAECLIVPAIVRYEVGRYVLAHSGEVAREMAIRAMAKFEQVAVDAAVADEASHLAAKHKMAMADALIYAVARARDAELWTQDSHFKNLPGVRFFKK